jgi:hypothetical protein
MNVYVAFKRYFDAAKTAETPTWRTVYLLGIMCATAVNHGNLVAFVGEAGYGSDWPDPRLPASTNPMRRRTD